MLKSFMCRVLSYCFLGVLATTGSAFAYTLSVVSAGGTKYNVMGTLDGVAGIDFIVKYDTKGLTQPTASPGNAVAGALFQPYIAPGIVRIAIINATPFSGSGIVATITFATKTVDSALPVIISAKVIDVNGTDIAATKSSDSSSSDSSTTLTGDGKTNQTTGGNNGTTNPATTGGTITQIYAAGTITLPTDLQRSDSPPPRSDQTPKIEPTRSEIIPSRGADSATPPEQTTGEAKAEEARQSVIYTGIVDKFKLPKGKKTLESLAALFTAGLGHNIRQEPAVILSDGKESATLTIDLPERLTTSPNFSVSSGTLVSLRQDKLKKGRWIAVVLPEAGTPSVSVTVVAGAEDFEFPLTVAPVITTKLPLNEQGWETFQREVGTPQSPLHDFNGDGIRNYLDEFIFVANSLVQLKKPAPPAIAPEKPAKVKADHR